VSRSEGIWGERVERIWRALLAQRGRERALLRLIHATYVPVLLIGNDLRYREANMASRLFLRRPARNVRSLKTFDLVPPRHHQAFVALWTKLLREHEIAGSISMRSPDGAEIPIDYRAAANVLPGVHLFVWLPPRWT
jgi:hypothetical protein